MLLGLVLSATIATTGVEAFVSLSSPQSSFLRTSKFSGPAIETGPIFAQNGRLNLRNAGRNRPSNTFLSASAKGGLSLEYITSDSTKIAYDFIPGNRPTVVYLPSFNQTRFGSKASALQTWCKRNKQGYFAADYYGCGGSGGQYQDGTISRWTRDTVELIENVVKGPVLLVGSGVGGWVMMHVALQRPKLVKGLVGIAPTPDFTKDVVLPVLDEETKRKIKETGMEEILWGGNTYTISQKLIDDASDQLVLQGGPKSIGITCPVRLIQGLGDQEIPPNRALKICDVVASEDVVITYVKYGDHMLDEEEDFERMTADVADLCSKIYEFDLSSPSSG